MHESFAALLQTPSAQRYKRLRTELLQAGSPSDHALKLANAERALLLGEVAVAEAMLAAVKFGSMLSLKWHRLSGMVALAHHNLERAQLHKFTFDALRTAILATGNGTRRRPYWVTYASDSTELAIAQGLAVKSQSLVEVADQRYDVVLGEDEHEYWFRVTDLLPVTSLVQTRKRRPSIAAGGAAKSRAPKAVSRNRH